MDVKNVALIIIFNHRYDKNISILKKLYKNSFSNIYFLVPFYDGEEENVIPVYENSYYFQGYVAQGFKSYFDEAFDHYFFIGDDLILNPKINENNYQEFFSLNPDTSFIPEIETMPFKKWTFNRLALTYNPHKVGVEIKKEIPSAEVARKILEKQGITNKRYKYRDVYFYMGLVSIKNIFKQLTSIFYDKVVLEANMKETKYPFARSYSDIFIISKKSIRKFIQYSGAFAASDLWVEVAIPTALLLCEEQITTESKLKMKGRTLWSSEDYQELKPYPDLETLLTNFPPSYLYIHPIKLSMWKNCF